MSLGHKDWQPWVVEEEQALPLLKVAYDRGVNTWDTANVYSNGVSEELIGKAIRKYSIPREDLVILTKCSSWVGNSPDSKAYMFREECNQSKDYVNKGGLSRKAIFSAVDASLQRMGIEYIDLLQIHRFDANTPMEETLEALHSLIKSGKTYQFATMQHIAEKHNWTKFISMQNHYNLLYREEEREMNRFCNETGVGLIPWSPLCRGHLARPPTTPITSIRTTSEEKMKSFLQTGYADKDQEIIRRVHELAEKKGWSMSNVALAWLNRRVTSPIIGCSGIERLDDALAVRGKVLTADEEKYLEELYVARDISGHN
ncbi:hypothetical protein LTR78_005962 [Recurvomyces mirabilis]|uniref:NADP-dependent oxidoreductase domain-containing protein n=1 Tax=Recurvomyces mirabilis TaxID=574656 RepID=A0AAE0WLZ4_9PEZI|nr:hypothetical protein LTR78_005962 [Recurvomyces mirabilis]